MTQKRRYKVVLVPSEEGVADSCPGLPGCWSQGADEAEALANIAEAIREYLAAIAEAGADAAASAPASLISQIARSVK